MKILWSFTQHVDHFNVTCIDIPEIALLIDSLKPNISLGPEYTARAFKSKSDGKCTVAAPSYRTIWWNFAPRRRTITEDKNWRGITVLSMVNMMVSHIVNKRLSNYLSSKLRNEQAVFRDHRLCIDHVNTFRIFGERRLICRGVPLKFINLICALYYGSGCQVWHEQ